MPMTYFVYCGGYAIFSTNVVALRWLAVRLQGMFPTVNIRRRPERWSDRIGLGIVDYRIDHS
jgi:hypothetical protein